jgi:hypothetical protein
MAYLLGKLRCLVRRLHISLSVLIILIASLKGCEHREQYHAIGSPEVHEYARFDLAGIGTGTTSILMTIRHPTI